MKTKSKSDILKIGWYQIIGGGIGELFILYSLFSPTQVSGFEVLVYISMLLFFGYFHTEKAYFSIVTFAPIVTLVSWLEANA